MGAGKGKGRSSQRQFHENLHDLPVDAQISIGAALCYVYWRIMNTTKFQMCFAISLGLALNAALAGCAGADGRYPSLAVRDAERVQGTLTPTNDEPEISSQAPQIEAIEAIIGQAQSAHASFSAQKGEVSALVMSARGFSIEDDRHARALTGLAQLTSLRGQTALALSQLDLMEAKAATGFKRTQDIRALQNAILRMIAEQDATLETLSETLEL